MKVHHYYSKAGKNLILEYIDSLPMDEQVDGYSVLKNMGENQFNQVKFKQWKRKIYEVYFYKHNRIFYVVVNNNDIYLLHACRKQKNKTEKRDIRIIETRARELSKELGKTFI